MKIQTRLLAMPHELIRQGDYCFFETQVEGHPGNLWLYILLETSAGVTALRIHRGKLEKSTDPLRVLTWDGDRIAPTITEPLNERPQYNLTRGLLVCP